MKMNFSILLIVSLLSAVMSNTWIGNLVNMTAKDSTMAKPAQLDKDNPIDVHFRDLSFFSVENFNSPIDTFVFPLNTTGSIIKNKALQLVGIDVTGIRTLVDSKISFSVGACDWSGERCIPSTNKLQGYYSRQFDKEALKFKNSAFLKVADFGTEGQFFYIYLQIMQIPDKDNLYYNGWLSLSQQHSTDFNRTVTDSGVALTLSLTNKN